MFPCFPSAGVVEKLEQCGNVELVLDSVLVGAKAEPILKSVTVKNVKTDEEKELEVNGLFVAIGQQPQTKGFEHILPLDENGYVLADEVCQVKKGIFVAGDCRKKPIRQLTTAVSDGTVAAVRASEYIK